ncbi:undecaprenyldiphospho-muramoylpentapeptidebeta-N-acetylglucosaminyltransferase [Clostridium tetani 12124569]|nr:undecaprenyldiphospho-muramoylpentapeptidebeta-N-acetylglucosaminyltransferase [Clostridium tetani 12124569]
MCYFPRNIKKYKKNKGVLTGTPIREELFLGNEEEGKKICGFKNNKPIVLLMGGSLGSKILNNLIRENIEELLKKFNIIHICGKGNIEKTL